LLFVREWWLGSAFLPLESKKTMTDNLNEFLKQRIGLDEDNEHDRPVPARQVRAEVVPLAPESGDLAAARVEDLLPKVEGGIITKWRHRALQSNKQAEAATTQFDAAIKILRTRLDFVAEQHRVHYDTQLAVIAENYRSLKIRDLSAVENQRFRDEEQALSTIASEYMSRVEEIDRHSLPEVLREMRMRQCLDAFTRANDRIRRLYAETE